MSPYQVKRDAGRGVKRASSAIHELAGSVTGHPAASIPATDGGAVGASVGDEFEVAVGEELVASSFGAHATQTSKSATSSDGFI